MFLEGFTDPMFAEAGPIVADVRDNDETPHDRVKLLEIVVAKHDRRLLPFVFSEGSHHDLAASLDLLFEPLIKDFELGLKTIALGDFKEQAALLLRESLQLGAAGTFKDAGHDFGTTGRFEVGAESFPVGEDGLYAEAQFLGDLFVGQSLGSETEDF
jgi:hypothetical protein